MRGALIFATLALAACETTTAGGSAGMREFMVIGNRMSFEECRARGGLIIRDSNTAMVACDPSVRGEPAPADEFDNPANRGVT